MMEPFVTALGQGLNLTSTEIADIIWLAVQVGELPATVDVVLPENLGVDGDQVLRQIHQRQKFIWMIDRLGIALVWVG
jgi:hypothetical protein